MKTKYLLLGLLIISLIFSAGCNNQPDTPAESETTYLPFSDEALGVSLVYPEGWVSHNAIGGLTVATSQAIIDAESMATLDDGGFLNIITGELAMFNFQIGQEIQPDESLVALGVYKQLLEQTGQSFQVVEPPVELTVEGASSSSMTVLRSMEDGKQLHTLLAVIIAENNMALISAASLEFKAEEYRPTFDHIIQSIRVSTPQIAE